MSNELDIMFLFFSEKSGGKRVFQVVVMLGYNPSIQGVPEKMFFSEVGTLLTKENFFWDTW